MKIVVVEDEATIRRGIIQLIEQIDDKYQVVGEADNGADGERLIFEQRPDLIITDIKMPDMSGLEMLENLKKHHLEQRSVILSGYSEFEYAKRAIKAGVQEYLLKPFTEGELRRVLADISLSIDLQKMMKSGIEGEAVSLDFYLNSILLGTPVNLDGLVSKLHREYGLDITQPFYIAALYMNGDSKEAEESWGGLLQSRLKASMGRPLYLFKMRADHIHLLMMPDQQSVDNFCRVAKNILFTQQQPLNLAIGLIKCEDINSFRKQFTELKKDLQWSIVLGDQAIIDHAHIQQMVTQIIQYPIEIERQIVLHIHAMDLAKMKASCLEFLQFWTSNLFHPDDVINAFVQFSSAMVNAAKKTCVQWEQTLNLRKVYLRLMDSLTWRELSGALLDLYAEMHAFAEDLNLEYSPVIKRAINYIDTHLQERITQLEVADKLHITPEYLSLLFAKEVGNNFNAYVKEKKMNRAKELLLKGNMSGYEISTMLGFTDPKYFYKVFKEVTGLSTSDFIKIHRR